MHEISSVQEALGVLVLSFDVVEQVRTTANMAAAGLQ